MQCSSMSSHLRLLHLSRRAESTLRTLRERRAPSAASFASLSRKPATKQHPKVTRLQSANSLKAANSLQYPAVRHALSGEGLTAITASAELLDCDMLR